MSTSPVTSGAGVTGAAIGNPVSGADIIAFVEMLLLQQYDAELADLAKGIQDNMRIKDYYRKMISDLKQLKSLTVAEHSGRPSVKVDRDQLRLVREERVAQLQGNGEVAGTFVRDRHSSADGETADGPYWIPVDMIDAAISDYEGKIASVSAQSEMAQLRLQQLTNQRALALQTITNILKKDAETKEAIVRNIA